MDQHRLHPDDWRAVQREDGSIFFEHGDPAGSYEAFDVATRDWGLAVRFVAAMNFYNRLLRESKAGTGPALLREEQLREPVLPGERRWGKSPMEQVKEDQVSLGKRIGEAIRAATKLRTVPLAIRPETTLRELAQICKTYNAYFFLSEQGEYQLTPSKEIETPKIAKGTIEP